jgi:hypothetical protein
VKVTVIIESAAIDQFSIESSGQFPDKAEVDFIVNLVRDKLTPVDCGIGVTFPVGEVSD